MLTRRIVPCLDIRGGRVVKGVKFVGIRDAGDPVEAAARYNETGADELVLLDIDASREGRDAMRDVVARTAEQVFIPFTVGGGMRSVDAIRDYLRLGADKVSLNTPAFETPELIQQAAMVFGSQCIVVAIDARRRQSTAGAGSDAGTDGWEVYTHGGHNATGADVVEWAYKAEQYGAGEILLTSMDRDGTGDGYDIELTKAVADAVSIPVIASGGAGCMGHFKDVFQQAGADAALAATLFHYEQIRIPDLKDYLIGEGIPIRPYDRQQEG